VKGKRIIIKVTRTGQYVITEETAMESAAFQDGRNWYEQQDIAKE